MKRFCFKRPVFLIALLVAGAIINIAVTWAINLYGGGIPFETDNFRILAREAALDLWTKHAPSEWPAIIHREGNAVESWDTGESSLFILADEATPNDPRPDSRSFGLAFQATGWPMRGLEYKQLIVREGRSATSSLHWSLQLPRNASWLPAKGSRTLPLRPRWPGFAINTTFYAVILWMLFAAPFALRRRIRIKRGECAACEYSLRGNAPKSDKCPVCGVAPVSSKHNCYNRTMGQVRW